MSKDIGTLPNTKLPVLKLIKMNYITNITMYKRAIFNGIVLIIAKQKGGRMF